MNLLRSISSIPLILSISLLHVGCCVVPIVFVTASSFSFAGSLSQYKYIFIWMQILVLIYVLIRLALDCGGKKLFRVRLEKAAFQISFLIAIAGLYVGYVEPFKSENQRIAENQFKIFQSHRQLKLSVEGEFEPRALKEELANIKGVKPHRTVVESTSVSLIFKVDEVSGSEILTRLREKGYDVKTKRTIY